MEVGNFSKRTLLTGAGWSHNWGARLAADVWQLVMDHSEVAGNERLRALLLEEGSFEGALAKTQTPPFTSDDRQSFERALVEAFVSMDRAMTRPFDGSTTINIYQVQELLFRFCGLRGEGFGEGYFFTLNQDLFPERRLYNSMSPARRRHRYPASRLFLASLYSRRTSAPIRISSSCAPFPTRPSGDACGANSISSSCTDHSTGERLTPAM